MAELNLDKSKTALLMADFATIGIGENPIAQERHTLDRAREVLNAARSADIFVCYCPISGQDFQKSLTGT